MHRVLVVEDDALLRRGMAALMKSRGHEVMTASTIAEGMNALEWGPTHVFLDMNLPDGEGTTILRHIRAESLPIKVAVLSGSGDAKLMAEVDALKPDVRFKKPTKWDTLLDWIDA